MPAEKSIVIHWGLPEEELYAACPNAEAINIKPHKKLPKEALALIRKNLLGTRLVICGTYLTELDPFIMENNCPVTVLVYSAEDLEAKKYGEYCEYKLLRRELPVAKHPWMRHILNRTLPDAKEEDEAFFHGVLHVHKDEAMRGAMLDVYRKMRESGCDESRYISIGTIISDHISQLAVFQAKSAAARMRAGGQDALVISGAWSPVLPIVKHLSAGGLLGVVVRYNFETQCTHFTFSGGDLSFVKEPPYNGGGDTKVSGATIPGIIPIDTKRPLEECITVAMAAK